MSGDRGGESAEDTHEQHQDRAGGASPAEGDPDSVEKPDPGKAPSADPAKGPGPYGNPEVDEESLRKKQEERDRTGN